MFCINGPLKLCIQVKNMQLSTVTLLTGFVLQF